MSDKEFEDLINGVNQPKPKQVFKMGVQPGKQSYQSVHQSNKDAVVPGEFGKQLAQQQFNTKINEGLWSKEDIRRLIDKENEENAK